MYFVHLDTHWTNMLLKERFRNHFCLQTELGTSSKHWSLTSVFSIVFYFSEVLPKLVFLCVLTIVISIVVSRNKAIKYKWAPIEKTSTLQPDMISVPIMSARGRLRQEDFCSEFGASLPAQWAHELRREILSSKANRESPICIIWIKL